MMRFKTSLISELSKEKEALLSEFNKKINNRDEFASIDELEFFLEDKINFSQDFDIRHRNLKNQLNLERLKVDLGQIETKRNTLSKESEDKKKEFNSFLSLVKSEVDIYKTNLRSNENTELSEVIEIGNNPFQNQITETIDSKRNIVLKNNFVNEHTGYLDFRIPTRSRFSIEDSQTSNTAYKYNLKKNKEFEVFLVSVSFEKTEKINSLLIKTNNPELYEIDRVNNIVKGTSVGINDFSTERVKLGLLINFDKETESTKLKIEIKSFLKKDVEEVEIKYDVLSNEIEKILEGDQGTKQIKEIKNLTVFYLEVEDIICFKFQEQETKFFHSRTKVEESNKSFKIIADYEGYLDCLVNVKLLNENKEIDEEFSFVYMPTNDSLTREISYGIKVGNRFRLKCSSLPIANTIEVGGIGTLNDLEVKRIGNYFYIIFSNPLEEGKPYKIEYRINSTSNPKIVITKYSYIDADGFINFDKEYSSAIIDCKFFLRKEGELRKIRTITKNE